MKFVIFAKPLSNFDDGVSVRPTDGTEPPPAGVRGAAGPRNDRGEPGIGRTGRTTSGGQATEGETRRGRDAAHAAAPPTTGEQLWEGCCPKWQFDKIPVSVGRSRVRFEFFNCRDFFDTVKFNCKALTVTELFY